MEPQTNIPRRSDRLKELRRKVRKKEYDRQKKDGKNPRVARGLKNLKKLTPAQWYKFSDCSIDIYGDEEESEILLVSIFLRIQSQTNINRTYV